jgi:hypothetical protein
MRKSAKKKISKKTRLTEGEKRTALDLLEQADLCIGDIRWVTGRFQNMLGSVHRDQVERIRSALPRFVHTIDQVQAVWKTVRRESDYL